jgi:hypothetical protein
MTTESRPVALSAVEQSLVVAAETPQNLDGVPATDEATFSLCTADSQMQAGATVRALVFHKWATKDSLEHQIMALSDHFQMVSSQSLSRTAVTVGGYNSRGEMFATADW